ncbi:MAG: chorismate synthase [Chloroflexi bacterium]|nr:chorismate synthase [Chloroflexota bacterium]|tara:strand:- start:9160 stop:10359 length:1200 start_codon:yes stop_codon:yes gene_type:complete
MFRFITAGESHGPSLSVILEGLPAGLNIDEDNIKVDLQRRQKGFGRGGRMKIEKDHAVIRSGVRHGISIGSPISLWIENKDFENWTEAMSPYPVDQSVDKKEFTKIVPGHADFAGALKYKQHDLRNVLERASARETTARVAAGALCKSMLKELGIIIRSRVISIGDSVPSHTLDSKELESINWEAIEKSEVRTDSKDLEKKFINSILKAKKDRTTVGGIFQVIAFNMPVGLGSFTQWDRKLDGKIAQAMMSINAVKGVEIGSGFLNTRKPGRNVHDIIIPDQSDIRNFNHESNHAGGLEGGVSNGEPIIVNVAIKPIATMTNPLPSVDINSGEIVEAQYNRSDICQVPPACVIGEAMLALCLSEVAIEKFGGDHIDEMITNFSNYQKSHKEFGIKKNEK